MTPHCRRNSARQGGRQFGSVRTGRHWSSAHGEAADGDWKRQVAQFDLRDPARAPAREARGPIGNGAPLPALAFVVGLVLAAQSALGENKLLIVNSDASVRKYLAAQTAFKESGIETVREVDVSARGFDVGRLAKLVKQEAPDLLYCIGSKAYLMAYKVDRNRKMVVSSAIGWQRFPLGDQTYGIATQLPAGAQLTMFRYFFPDIRRIGVLYSKKFNAEWLEQAEQEAAETEVKLESAAFRRSSDIERALPKLLAEVDALWLIPDPIVLSDVKALREIFSTCEAQKKPIFSYNEAFAEQGAALAISADLPTIGRQAAGIAETLLAEETPDERFQPPAGSEIVLNMATVRKCGLKLNQDALDSVNRIIK